MGSAPNFIQYLLQIRLELRVNVFDSLGPGFVIVDRVGKARCVYDGKLQLHTPLLDLLGGCLCKDEVHIS